ncbi:hypothetical protein PUN28_001621 [Cardiocondyla obscurior]|uniref:Uncharacterized protein n=1 Tax=Cardiocondyla obscurior TaxID=286306 RepID=A0AAW2GQE5_9HYME
MFHGSRGIGGSPFTPTIPRSRRRDRLSFRVAANESARKNNTPSAIASAESICRRATTRNGKTLLHQSERFITRRVCARTDLLDCREQYYNGVLRFYVPSSIRTTVPRAFIDALTSSNAR